jgi:small subunit ribosomal protein S17
MAEKNEETPENIQEEVETAATPEGAGETTTSEEKASEETAPANTQTASPSGTGPATKAGQNRAEKLEAKRAERRAAAGKRPSRTPEERNAERLERRAAVAKQRRAYRERSKVRRADARKDAPAPEPQHAPEHGPGRAKVRQGVVVSDSAEKTITVAINVVRRHKRYHKILRSTVKLHAHDERGDAHPGDTVRVQECRPMSRTKRWRLVEVVERAK